MRSQNYLSVGLKPEGIQYENISAIFGFHLVESCGMGAGYNTFGFLTHG